jgi:hypothetical protein
MRFESRELPPYAEPVSASVLNPGEVYFSVQFLDENLLIPTMEPFVFLGKNLSGDDEDCLYFQSFESYRQGIRFESTSEEDARISKLPHQEM